MSAYLLAFLIGVIAGLRAITAPAIVSLATVFGWMHLMYTPLAFLGYTPSPYILSALAIVELIADKLPKTPSRKAPLGFGVRLITGGICGAAIGASSLAPLAGTLIMGVIGSIAGTLGGYDFRLQLARAVGGKDLPIALIEDAIAIGGSFLIVIWISGRLSASVPVNDYI